MADLLVTHGNVAAVTGASGPRTRDAMAVDVWPDHAVAVEGGRITFVGPSKDAPEATQVIDARGGLVTPGYVDAHTHVVYGGDRASEVGMRLSGKSYLEILAAGGGIASTTKQTRHASVADLAASAGRRMHEMRRHGTTALECKSGYALTNDGELRMLEAGAQAADETGLRAVHTFLGAHAVPEAYKDDVDGYVDLVVAMLPAVREQGIASFCDVFVEKGVFTVAQGQRILEAAAKLGFGLRLHADEIQDLGGAALAARTGCASADHLLAVSDRGIRALADAGVTAVLLPTVPITLMAPKWAPGRAMLDAGVPVALASDHNPNNPITDMGLVAQLGAYLLGLSPAQALTAVTHNAAASLGLDAELGSLAVGMRGDVLVHDVPDLDHWVYQIGRKTVRDVIVGGIRVGGAATVS